LIAREERGVRALVCSTQRFEKDFDMSDRDKDGFIGSASGGNTAGTGGPEHGSMGEGAADVPTGAGQGDDLADALGGRESGSSGAAPESGDMSAGRSEPTGGGSPVAAGGGADAGSPGGMGGVRGGMPNPDHRPNGGVSPIQSGGDNDRH
jgi:hypothetical protein